MVSQMGNRYLDYYRRILEAVEREVTHPTGVERDELLSADAYDLLVARDVLSEVSLTTRESEELEHLDALLLRHRQLVIANVAADTTKPASRWWWHLHDGPRVRERARRVA